MSSYSSSRPIGKVSNTESCPSAKEIWKIFSVPFEVSDLEDKIKECENSACCILKKIENLTTKKMKLVCAKQKCPFSIRLETIDGKYLLRDIQGEHNHSVSKEKFEEKLLTGRLLDYADFIYQTYFLSDSDFCSKPKLILKDLKNRHGIDLLSGNFSPSQRQKLKKKFDNIVQQLRLKKSRSDGSIIASPNPPLKKSISAMTSNRDATQSLSAREYAISSASTLHGDSTNKKIKQTPFSFSNVPMKVAAPGILDLAAYGSYQQQLQYQQAQMQFQQQQQLQQQQIQKQEIPSQFPLIHPFQLSLLKQQIQQQQELQISGGKQFINQGPQVISEDSRSISQCKIEDQSEQSSEIQLVPQQELSISAPVNIAKANSCLSMTSPAPTLSILSSHSPLQMMNQLSPLGLGSIQNMGTAQSLSSIGVPPFDSACFLQQQEQQMQPNIQQQIQQILQQQLHNQLAHSLVQQQYQQQQQQLQQQQQQQQIQQFYLRQNLSQLSQYGSLFGGNINSTANGNSSSVFSLPSPLQLQTKSDSSFPPSQSQQLMTLPTLQQLLLQSSQVNKSDSINDANNLPDQMQSLFQAPNQDSYNESCISTNQQAQTLLPSAA